jgi:hypothetical protein
MNAQAATDNGFADVAEEQRRDLATPAPLNPFAGRTAAEPATVSVAQSREIAEVQAGMVIAQRFPRNEVAAMDRILNACTRPTLAESALYEYARGGTKINGPSIRLAEVIAQNWGHIHMGVRELEQANGESTVEAYAYDVQTGTRDAKVFHVRHWRDTKSGGYKIEDGRDIYELVANVGARRKRACILAVIPGDVVEAAVDACEKTLAIKSEVTPERLKEIAAVFAGFGVSVAAIEKKIQRRLDAMTPGQMLNLRKIANSLRDEMSAPADWFELDQAAGAATATAEQPKKGAAGLKDAAAKGAREAIAKQALNESGAGASYADIAAAINKAADTGAVDDAEALIDDCIEDKGQQKELHDLARARRIELS